MNPYVAVKLLILTSLWLFLFEANAEQVQFVPQFDCGEYLVQGKLILNKENTFVLSVKNGTSSPFELILLGGDFDSKLTAAGKFVGVQVYVPQRITSQKLPYTYLISIRSFKTSNPWVTKIKTSKCGIGFDTFKKK